MEKAKVERVFWIVIVVALLLKIWSFQFEKQASTNGTEVEVTTTPVVAVSTPSPNVVKATAEPTVEPTVEPTAEPTAEPVASPSAEAQNVGSSEGRLKLNIVLEDGTRVGASDMGAVSITPSPTPVVITEVQKGNTSGFSLGLNIVMDDDNGVKFSNGSSNVMLTIEPKTSATPLPSSESGGILKLNIHSDSDVGNPEITTADNVLVTGKTAFIREGFELCDFLLDNTGHVVGMEYPEELQARNWNAIDVSAGYGSIKDVVRPANTEESRVDGRFVRSKRPHKVEMEDGKIVKGFSQIPLRLEVVNPEILVQMVGKPLEEITAQDVVATTLIAQNIDDDWVAAHKIAPGFRGPLVAKLHMEDGKWIRVEQWDWETHYNKTAGYEDPMSLVFVICSKERV